ncbi:MAG: enoyl-CoA hydratase-related protein [Pseudomonadota bacterium]
MTDAAKTIWIEDEGDHLVVVSDNPANKNALTPEYHTLLFEALERAGKEDRIASVILVGRSGYFCAGGELATLNSSLKGEGAMTPDAIIKELQDCAAAIRACPKPVIAAVAGGAAGGGFSVVMACDFVVAEEEAKFVPAYVKIAATPDGGLTSYLANQLPHQLASEICLLGSLLPAQKLHQHGMVNRLTAPGEAEQEAKTIAAKLARGPVATHAKMKELLVAGRTNTLVDQLDLELTTLVNVLQSPSAAEGISAFVEKRKPDFPKVEGRT